MPGVYEHIRFQKETLIKERRGRSFPPPKFDTNPKEHATLLTSQIKSAKDRFRDDEFPGFDDRLLLKLKVRDRYDASEFETIPGFQFISQEDNEIVLLFAAEEALDEFEKRLATFGATGNVTRKDLIEASRAIDLWTPEDRKGEILRKEGIPKSENFLLDVELWPIDQSATRSKMLASFKDWLEKKEIIFLDSISNDYVTIIRVRCNKKNCESLFHYRDVRTIDIPPRYTLEYSLLQTDLTELPSPAVLPDTATRVAVLDSGINSNHPLLKGVVGDNRSYIHSESPTDATGHGTAVAGIATYGNIENSINSKTFIPHVWILSGRILDENNDFNEEFIENQIERAVKEFHSEYSCKVFNLSIGDEKRPYKGGKAGVLSMMLDNLSHELDILFVVSSGNLNKSVIQDKLKRGLKYPNYLLLDSEILEPSNAINVLTIGGISRYDKSRTAGRYPNDPSYQPIAHIESVSPFSRSGPGVAGCIKPDLVAYAGNLAFDHRSKMILEHGLGEISLNNQFSSSNLFSEFWGTSFSAPYITHLIGRAFSSISNASALLIRALLISNARSEFLNLPNQLKEDEKLRLVGYGKVDEEFLYRSSEDVVVLFFCQKYESKL